MGGEGVGGECVWRGGVCVESAWGVSGGQGGGNLWGEGSQK